MSESYIENGDFRIRVDVEQYPENPRDDYDFQAHAIRDRHYILSEIDKGDHTLKDAWRHLDDTYSHRQAVRIFSLYVRLIHGGVIITDPAEIESWSLWYMTGEDLEREQLTPEQAEKNIRGEIKEFAAWASGDVFRLTLERRVLDAEDPESDEWEELESVGAYYGDDAVKAAAEPTLASALEAYGPPKPAPVKPRKLTGPEHAAEHLAADLVNLHYAAEQIARYAREAKRKTDMTDHQRATWLGEIIRDRVINAERAERELRRHTMSRTWAALIGFVDWAHVGRFFLGHEDD